MDGVQTKGLERVEIGIGEMAVGRSPRILATSALGSCVAVAIWDPFTLGGGLAHVMLPSATRSNHPGPSMRFADVAVPAIVKKLLGRGSIKSRLVAKIAGGATMFQDSDSGSSVGDRNVTEVRARLEELGVSVRASDTGGGHARSVQLHLDSGTLVVRSYMYGIREL